MKSFSIAVVTIGTVGVVVCFFLLSAEYLPFQDASITQIEAQENNIRLLTTLLINFLVLMVSGLVLFFVTRKE